MPRDVTEPDWNAPLERVTECTCHRGAEVCPFCRKAEARLPRRMIYAGSDRRGFRTEEKRRRKDLEFLTRVRAAGLEELLTMFQNHAKGPEWKIVAIRRGIEREQRTEREKQGVRRER